MKKVCFVFEAGMPCMPVVGDTKKVPFRWRSTRFHILNPKHIDYMVPFSSLERGFEIHREIL